MTPSISGMRLCSCSPYRWAKHPATINCCPLRFCAACSRMTCVDSSFAGSMNAQVLMTTVSASRGCDSNCQPAAPSFAIITSVSTKFFAQPRLTNATLRMRLPIVHELQRQLELHPAQRRDDLLQIVLILSGDADLFVLILRRYSEVQRLDVRKQ